MGNKEIKMGPILEWIICCLICCFFTVLLLKLHKEDFFSKPAEAPKGIQSVTEAPALQTEWVAFKAESLQKFIDTLKLLDNKECINFQKTSKEWIIKPAEGKKDEFDVEFQIFDSTEVKGFSFDIRGDTAKAKVQDLDNLILFYDAKTKNQNQQRLTSAQKKRKRKT